MKDIDEMTDAEYDAFLVEYYGKVIPVELDAATLVTAHGVLFGNVNTMPLCYKLSSTIEKGGTTTLQLTRRELYDIMSAMSKARKVFEAERRRARTAGDVNRMDECSHRIARLDDLYERLTAALADANK